MNSTLTGSMIQIRLSISTAALALLSVALLLWQDVAFATPEETVQAVTEEVLETLQARRADLEADPGLVNQLIDEVIAPYIDFDVMSRMVLVAAGSALMAAKGSAIPSSPVLYR